MIKKWVNSKKRAHPMPRPHNDPRPYATCAKCGHHIVMTCIDNHLLKCQPNGAMCPVCKEIQKPIGFTAHLQACFKEAVLITEEIRGITW